MKKVLALAVLIVGMSAATASAQITTYEFWAQPRIDYTYVEPIPYGIYDIGPAYRPLLLRPARRAYIAPRHLWACPY